MTKHDRNLGFCEEANTYCSIAEKEYKQIRAEIIEEVYNDLIDISESAYVHSVLQEKIEKYKQLKEE